MKTRKQRKLRHGHSVTGNKSVEYICWSSMKQRCYNPKSQKFRHYGGRGIIVCKEWKDSFSTFLEDMGLRPDGLSLDRINNEGNYEKGNCKWSTPLEQTRNRGLSANNTSGVSGVSFLKNVGVFEVTINTNYKRKYLGAFKNIEDAKLARQAGEKKYWNK